MDEEISKICNPEVFESIFKAHAKDLKRFLYFKTRDMALAEDLLQDTFVQLWNNCGKVTFSKVKSYLYTVANNKFLNHVKRGKIEIAHQKGISRKVMHETPEFLMVEKEFLEKIERTIAALPEKQREVFLLNRIEKKKYKEIADMLQISIKTVEKRMHEALKTMKEHIGRV